ncbi:hypothetical protein IFT48_35005, partial [Pseudomonas fluorescens]|uniref:hypothetical protein n=1 Tax=Pseudomonas fluorescens TaxID=294 RepID=UPI0019063D19
MDVPTLYPPLVTLPPKRKPIFLGKAIAGANVKVCRTNNADDILAETTADTNGSWLVRSNKELPFGKNSISAYYDKKKGYAPNLEFYIEAPVVVQGNQLQPADIIESPAISYLLPAGSAPIILSPQSGMTLPSPSFIISGQAPANTSVRLFTQDNTDLGVANADEKGDWSAPIELALTTRDVAIKAAIFTTNGSQASAWSMNSLFQIQSVFFSIDGFFNKLFSMDEDSSLPSGSAPQLTSPTTVNSLRPLLTGKAAANAIVYVYLAGGSVLFGKPQADGNGDWQLQLSQDISPGSTSLALAEFNANGGQVSGWTSVTLTTNATPTGTALPYGSVPIIDEPKVGQPITTLRPTFKGRAAPNTEIRIAKDDWSFNIKPIKVDAQGFWQIQAPVDMPVASDGSIGLLTAQYDGQNYAGAMASAWSEPYRFTVKSQTPPVQNTLPYGSVPIIDEPAPGQSITTLRPTFKGRAAPNTEIRIAKDDWSFNIKPIKVDAQGFWQIQAPVDMPVASDGTIGLLTAQYDGQNYAGAMASAWSEPYRFTVKHQTNALPSGSAPQLTSPTTVNSLRPLLTGKAAANAIVYVFLAGGS